MTAPDTPTAVGYPCAAMLRHRPGATETRRIEVYPTSQWGLLGDYEGPENAMHASLLRLASRGERPYTTPPTTQENHHA